ncbi:unnamed protein product [Fraxinus pennsylvanica]|uniref:Lactoylglutathione lyase n=1 Tax=Fraxinus pennsylvanica TaxID=56036 RepID=A0AAD2ECV0_9LAMI|nr:unnamed protein product [Fraxinus pennsylvanica]
MASSSSLTVAFSLLRSTIHRVPLSSSFPTLLTVKPKVLNQCRRFISTVMASKESASNNPGLQTTTDEATKSYFLQQAMIRVKDPKVSLDFYSRIMGMSLLKRLDFPELKFTLYFLGYEDTASAPEDPVERTAWTFGQKAALELRQVITMGTQNLMALDILDDKTKEPEILELEEFSSRGVKTPRYECLVDTTYRDANPSSWKIKDIAFVKDPDGYWIEIFDTALIAKSTAHAA